MTRCAAFACDVPDEATARWRAKGGNDGFVAAQSWYANVVGHISIKSVAAWGAACLALRVELLGSRIFDTSLESRAACAIAPLLVFFFSGTKIRTKTVRREFAVTWLNCLKCIVGTRTGSLLCRLSPDIVPIEDN